MANIEIKLKDALKKSFTLPTGQKHKIRLIRPTVFVLDVEDSHFNFDRKVLLPDLSSTDGSTPVLDTRRVTGLGVMFAALVHAKKNASQGLFVTGHTDASGTATYNQKLSEERAANVSLLLRGQRDDWRKLSAKDDAVDDVQTVLTWQNQRAGWDCDPQGIDNAAGPKTRQAIRGFQERYNLEVAKAQDAGLDSPFKKKIAEDGTAGPETWGAFYDVYMTELMDLLDVEAFSALEQQQAQLKPPPGWSISWAAASTSLSTRRGARPSRRERTNTWRARRRTRPTGGSRSCSSIRARRSTWSATPSRGSANQTSARSTSRFRTDRSRSGSPRGWRSPR